MKQNKYPIYVISKGRYHSRLTSKALEKINQPYRIVVEPCEYKMYANFIDPNKIIKTPIDFHKKEQGSIPVRNFVWEHSINEGHKKHWILDDNIYSFLRLNNNRKVPVDSGVLFTAIEDFVDRYENVQMAGMNYYFFAPKRQKMPPFYLNTRIYSCILLDNKVKHRWRGKYNEDTDLSLRILKDNKCTVLFNAFLCKKGDTLKTKGGNTNTIYNTGDERKEFAESLKRQHPDVVKVVRRYDRWHHHVDYSRFANNELILKKDVKIEDGVNNYGMVLKKKR
jgi:hypothetical protein